MKKYAGIVALLVFLFAGIAAVISAANDLTPTYSGQTDVYALMQDPSDYDLSDVNGVADVIVATDLSQTGAINNVASIVFDYRGYDTLGESFILLTAISGAFVVLNVSRKSKKAAQPVQEVTEDEK